MFTFGLNWIIHSLISPIWVKKWHELYQKRQDIWGQKSGQIKHCANLWILVSTRPGTAISPGTLRPIRAVCRSASGPRSNFRCNRKYIHNCNGSYSVTIVSCVPDSLHDKSGHLCIERARLLSLLVKHYYYSGTRTTATAWKADFGFWHSAPPSVWKILARHCQEKLDWKFYPVLDRELLGIFKAWVNKIFLSLANKTL